MNLFSLVNALGPKPINILPTDGMVYYYGKIIHGEIANVYFQSLLQQVQWNQDKIMMFGKEIVTNRKTAWYGHKSFPCTYSKVTKIALSWFGDLITIKTLVEDTANACLLNLYHSGTDSMGWHSDNEKGLVHNNTIASISLGSERKFF